MHEPNVTTLLQLLKPEDQVLDVGGWACPFNRAQWILDAEPFETRGFYRTFGGAPSQGGDVERFCKDTWVQRDICHHGPWPFRDKQFDFVICSHTLEDVRDPLWVCSELFRVGKRGYIEVPSRAWESCTGRERRGQVGLSHHRWLIEIRDDEIVFLHKWHMIHSHWRFALPRSYARTMTPEASVQWVWWNQPLRTRELAIHGIQAQERELEQFISTIRPYPTWRLQASAQFRLASSLANRATAGVGRRLRRWL